MKNGQPHQAALTICPMGPGQIKECTRQHLALRAPTARIIDELGIDGGKVIADMALVQPDVFIGYEIKSAADNSKRLPGQVIQYSRVFDRCTVIIDPKHTKNIETIIPEWWGIILIEDEKFFVLRQMQDNPKVDLKCLLKLLWRDEVYGACKQLGYAKITSARKYQLQNILLKELSSDDLRRLVRTVLFEREGWLADEGRRKMTTTEQAAYRNQKRLIP
jgi:hypothetical protein